MVIPLTQPSFFTSGFNWSSWCALDSTGSELGDGSDLAPRLMYTNCRNNTQVLDEMSWRVLMMPGGRNIMQEQVGKCIYVGVVVLVYYKLMS
jgi:hypothetical protein